MSPAVKQLMWSIRRGSRSWSSQGWRGPRLCRRLRFGVAGLHPASHVVDEDRRRRGRHGGAGHPWPRLRGSHAGVQVFLTRPTLDEPHPRNVYGISRPQRGRRIVRSHVERRDQTIELIRSGRRSGRWGTSRVDQRVRHFELGAQRRGVDATSAADDDELGAWRPLAPGIL